MNYFQGIKKQGQIIHCVPGFILALLLLALPACGGGGAGALPDESPAVNGAPEDANSLERLLYTDSYAGYLVVHFDEELSVRQDKTKAIVSLAGFEDRLAPIRDAIAIVPTAQVLRSVAATEAKVEEQRADLERISGKQLIDWNSIYHVTAADPDDALTLMRELVAKPGVAKVYPGMRGSTSGILTTPDLTGQQSYLLSEATYGGLNASAGWARGARGLDIYVVDNERGTGYSHEDLSLLKKGFWEGGNALYMPHYCENGITTACDPLPSEANVAHGSAVAGILAAKDNSHGVKGFAPDSTYLHAPMVGGTFLDLQEATDSVDDPLNHWSHDVEPGSVWVIEVQLPGKFSSGSCGSTPATAQGCVPTELWPEDFAAIQQATAYGVTVVSGAGNGTTDLNNPDLYTGEWDFAHNLATEDAGAIMVGASQGANEQKISYSNCGNRVNAFAWGAGVVTTSYPADANWGWQGTAPSGVNTSSDNPNNWYTNNFGGTSSAAAMVGGAAAQIQSYARASLGNRRFIMPLKMREIVTSTGVSQADTGCNIGKQPRVDQALNSVDTFIAQARSAYPELDSGEMLTTARYVSMRAMGVGIICKKWDPVGSDPLCPDSEIFPPGEGIGKDLDFDADGRADLVAWTNGTWKLDLSSRGPGGDNYGEWDIEIEHAPLPGRWVWPYVIDMNSDGRTDFVVYDKENGIFYIKFTDTALLRDGTWGGWDWEIDYSAEWKDDLKLNPAQSNYSRPILSDYNNDGWTDIGIFASDGKWRIDFGESSRSDFGQYETTVSIVSSDRLAEAPGWAYLPVIFKDTVTAIGYKVPDGLQEEGRLAMYDYTNPTYEMLQELNVPFMFGGNDKVPSFGFFNGPVAMGGIGLKGADASWRISRFTTTFEPFQATEPSAIYGDESCRPIVADFDGDETDDRAVMCPGEWRIAYSGSDTFASQRIADGSRRISLEYDTSTFTLPGRSYAGGVSYAWVKQSIENYQALDPNTPPPIPVDMAIAH